MKKRLFKRLLELIAVFTGVCILSGSFYIPVSAEENTSGEIGFNYTAKSIYTGKSFKLVLNNAPMKIKWWASADTSIATVDKNGNVTGVGPGTCKIKAKCNEIKYTCVVTVVDPYIKVTQDYIRVGTETKLTIKGDKAKSFSSSAPKIISVDNDGNITANKKGMATITAFCKSGRVLSVTLHVYENISVIENPTFDDLAPTTHMTFEELVGDSGEEGYPDMMPAPDTYKIIVDLYWKVVLVYTKNSLGEYTVPVRYMRCTVGVPGRTRTGTFKMLSTKNRFAHFNVGGNAQYWSLIVSATYFHSILYDAIDANTWTRSSWENLGKAVSHGCIRLPVPDARWIYYNAAPGTVVTIRSGSKDDKETKAISDQLILAKAPETRPNLKKGQIPWTDNWTIEDVPQEVKFVRYEQGSGK